MIDINAQHLPCGSGLSPSFNVRVLMAEVLGSVSAVLSIVQLSEKLVQYTRHVWKSEKDWEKFVGKVEELKRLSTALEEWASNLPGSHIHS